MSLAVTYLGHSGFTVRTAKHQLLFDYIGGPFVRDTSVPCIALASHVHGDHYDPSIARLADTCVLGDGIAPFLGAHVLKPGDALQVFGASIRAFGSTDCGVSFLIEADGHSLFHAGDLNFWHWRWESTPDEVSEALNAFDAVLDALDGLPVDLALFPVDARMGAGHDEGADMYMRRIRPKVLIPMHWWDRPDVARNYAEKHAGGSCRVIALTQPGETVDLF
ncbi:MAG: MBL fold metallo-hydrolase [Clostridia bacterium]|nr:MBL fold metallo-hydrolase [Clostridia bacterium]